MATSIDLSGFGSTFDVSSDSIASAMEAFTKQIESIGTESSLNSIISRMEEGEVDIEKNDEQEDTSPELPSDGEADDMGSPAASNKRGKKKSKTRMEEDDEDDEDKEEKDEDEGDDEEGAETEGRRRSRNRRRSMNRKGKTRMEDDDDAEKEEKEEEHDEDEEEERAEKKEEQEAEAKARKRKCDNLSAILRAAEESEDEDGNIDEGLEAFIRFTNALDDNSAREEVSSMESWIQDFMPESTSHLSNRRITVADIRAAQFRAENDRRDAYLRLAAGLDIV